MEQVIPIMGAVTCWFISSLTNKNFSYDSSYPLIPDPAVMSAVRRKKAFQRFA
jgi:hypothetical protein